MPKSNEVFTNRRGETVIPYQVFKFMDTDQIVKSLSRSTKKRRNRRHGRPNQ